MTAVAPDTMAQHHALRTDLSADHPLSGVPRLPDDAPEVLRAAEARMEKAVEGWAAARFRARQLRPEFGGNRAKEEAAADQALDEALNEAGAPVQAFRAEVDKRAAAWVAATEAAALGTVPPKEYSFVDDEDEARMLRRLDAMFADQRASATRQQLLATLQALPTAERRRELLEAMERDDLLPNLAVVMKLEPLTLSLLGIDQATVGLIRRRVYDHFGDGEGRAAIERDDGALKALAALGQRVNLRRGTILTPEELVSQAMKKRRG